MRNLSNDKHKRITRFTISILLIASFCVGYMLGSKTYSANVMSHEEIYNKSYEVYGVAENMFTSTLKSTNEMLELVLKSLEQTIDGEISVETLRSQMELSTSWYSYDLFRYSLFVSQPDSEKPFLPEWLYSPLSDYYFACGRFIDALQICLQKNEEFCCNRDQLSTLTEIVASGIPKPYTTGLWSKDEQKINNMLQYLETVTEKLNVICDQIEAGNT